MSDTKGFSVVSVVAALVVALLLVLGAFWLFGGNNSDSTGTSNSNSLTDSQTTTQLNNLTDELGAVSSQLAVVELTTTDYDNLKLQVANLTTTVNNLQLVAGPQGPTGATGATGPATVATCDYGICLSLQATSPGTTETGHLNISGNLIAGGNITATNLIGDGSSMTALNATQLTTGTLADARLSTNVALLDASQIFIILLLSVPQALL